MCIRYSILGMRLTLQHLGSDSLAYISDRLVCKTKERLCSHITPLPRALASCSVVDAKFRDTLGYWRRFTKAAESGASLHDSQSASIFILVN